MEEALKAAEEVDKSQQRARENCGGGRVITFFRSLWHEKDKRKSRCFTLLEGVTWENHYTLPRNPV